VLSTRQGFLRLGYSHSFTLLACGGGGGGGGGLLTVTVLEVEAVKPRESVQVALTVIGPAEAPVVVRGGGIAAARDAAAAGSPAADRDGGIVRTGAGATDGRGRSGFDRCRARRAGNVRRIQRLHGEVGAAAGRVVLLGLGIGNGGGGGVAASRDAVGVDRGAGILAFNLATIDRPGVGERVLRVEVAGGDGRVYRFTHHDFGRLNRAGRRYWNFRSSAKIEHQAGRQAGTVEVGTAELAFVRGHFLRKIFVRPLESASKTRK